MEIKLYSKTKRSRFGILAIVFALLCEVLTAIKFELDTQECWVHEVPSNGDLIYMSFVVINTHNPSSLYFWRRTNVAVDVRIVDPSGKQVHNIKKQMQGKHTLTSIQKGPYKFCFENRVSKLQTIDFNVNVVRLLQEKHAKDERVDVLMAYFARVQEALLVVQFEQQWLRSQTTQQAQVAEGTSRRVVCKAAVECLSLVACSAWQIVLLQRLFDQKLVNVRSLRV